MYKIYARTCHLCALITRSLVGVNLGAVRANIRHRTKLQGNYCLYHASAHETVVTVLDVSWSAAGKRGLTENRRFAERHA